MFGLVGVLELWLEYVVLPVCVARLISSPRSMVRVPWLLAEVDLPMVWPKTLSQLINVCYYYVVVSFI